MFPEYKKAKKFHQIGHFTKALPDYERILQVLDMIPANTSIPMTVYITSQIVDAYLHLGQFAKALQLIEHLQKNSKLTPSDTVYLTHLKAKLFIWQKDIPKALQTSIEATEQTENILSAEIDLNLVADSYSYLGLSYLLTSPTDGTHLQEAEAYLQLACRWSQSPVQQLRNTNNYAIYQYYHLLATSTDDHQQYGPSNKQPFNLWQSKIEYLQQSGKDALIKAASSSATTSSSSNNSKQQQILDEESRSALIFARDVLLETMYEKQQQVSNSTLGSSATAGSAAAAAICGPVTTATAATAASMMNMTGMSAQDIRNVPHVTTAAHSQQEVADNKAASTDNSLDSQLQSSLEYSVAYSSLLINLAEIESLLAASDTKPSALSQQYLPTALKTLQYHEEQYQAASGQQAGEGQLVACRGPMGRILTAIAIHHSAAGQMVTAEGLLRSARQYLQPFYAAEQPLQQQQQQTMMIYDPRYAYEKLWTEGVYYHLLCQWEKREAEGQAGKDQVIKQLIEVSKKGSVLSGLIQFP